MTGITMFGLFSAAGEDGPASGSCGEGLDGAGADDGGAAGDSDGGPVWVEGSGDAAEFVLLSVVERPCACGVVMAGNR